MRVENGFAAANIKKLSFKGSNNIQPPISLINENRMTDTFIRLAKIDTASKDGVTTFPTTEGQKVLAKLLVEELKKIGLEDIKIDQYHVVTATLPDNLGDIPDKPVIGLFAHMDTSDSVPTDNITPIIHKNYQGGDIKLKDGTVITAKELEPHKGADIVTSDGRTLLGADDKAGIAQILEVLRVYKENPGIKHPKIRIAFTPDEETGNFIENFDIKTFGATAAYTIDGGGPAEIETSTFNAHNAEIVITGHNVHPGYAKDKMINAVKLAADFIKELPDTESPEKTEGWEGYYHVACISGMEDQVKLNMLIRDFDYDKSLARVESVKQLAKKIEADHPGCKVEVTSKEMYRNMKSYLDKFPEVLANAIEGIKRSGIIPHEQCVRGGTDGSHLTLAGLPAPNLGTAGYNFHAKNEFLDLKEMKSCAANIINILSVWAEKTLAPSKKKE